MNKYTSRGCIMCFLRHQNWIQLWCMWDRGSATVEPYYTNYLEQRFRGVAELMKFSSRMIILWASFAYSTATSFKTSFWMHCAIVGRVDVLVGCRNSASASASRSSPEPLLFSTRAALRGARRCRVGLWLLLLLLEQREAPALLVQCVL